MISGSPARTGATSPSRTTITTTTEQTTRTESQKVPPPVAKKPDERYGTPTKKVISEELRYTTVPPPQKTVIEEMRYTTPPAKRTVIEEEYRLVACLIRAFYSIQGAPMEQLFTCRVVTLGTELSHCENCLPFQALFGLLSLSNIWKFMLTLCNSVFLISDTLPKEKSQPPHLPREISLKKEW